MLTLTVDREEAGAERDVNVKDAQSVFRDSGGYTTGRIHFLQTVKEGAD